jgi:hypothetical protein
MNGEGLVVLDLDAGDIFGIKLGIGKPGQRVLAHFIGEPLCANDDETDSASEFKLEGAGELFHGYAR